MGGGAGSSRPSISLETEFASGKLQIGRQTELWPPRGGRVEHMSPATGSLGPLLSADG